MSSHKTAKVAFVSACILLVLSGAATMFAIARYRSDARLVAHTYQVKATIGELDSAINRNSRARFAFIRLGTRSDLDEFDSADKMMTTDLGLLKRFLRRPQQEALMARVEPLIHQRAALLQQSLNVRMGDSGDDMARQNAITAESTGLGNRIDAILGQMQGNEDDLLKNRQMAASAVFIVTIGLIGGLLAAAVVLLWVHYHLLEKELTRREEAESGARHLSLRVLALQDEERRRFSRELHDGVGQMLAVSKMVASRIASAHREDRSCKELLDYLDRATVETRTLSHLLHPPLLDELGIASAMHWYLEGFAKRSGLQVQTQISDQIGRLPRPVELVLFRVLQEALTNVHRHANSASAEVSLSLQDRAAVLRIRDYGTGIPPEKLRRFQEEGTRAGVGLTSMRERVREHGGQFKIQSDPSGTEILVWIPVGDTGGGDENPPQQETHGSNYAQAAQG